MDKARLEEIRQQAKRRERQDEERRTKRFASDLRLQTQERQAQDQAHEEMVPPAEEQHYALLPRPTYTGIR